MAKAATKAAKTDGEVPVPRLKERFENEILPAADYVGDLSAQDLTALNGAVLNGAAPNGAAANDDALDEKRLMAKP